MVNTINSDIKKELKKIIKKEFIFITSRGNEAIEKSLEISKKLNKSKCFILDQGGWITYPKYISKLKLEQEIIPTTDCKIDLNYLEKNLDENSVLLIHSLSGYWYKQPMEEIYKICKSKKSLLINDCSGSICDKKLLVGDILFGSFGRWKPINNYQGGFISFNENYDFKFKDEIKIEDTEKLIDKIKTSEKRCEELNKISLEIIKKLEDKKISILNNLKNNSDLNLVVIAKYKNEKEKNEIISICNQENYPFEFCPREIRSLKKAISIEVKKLEF